jgi:hypothetical protein
MSFVFAIEFFWDLATAISDPTRGFWAMRRAYEELVDFIAAGSTVQGVVDFQPSTATRSLVADLIHRQKTGSHTAEETDELNQFLQMEHVMRLAKAHARQRLAS